MSFLKHLKRIRRLHHLICRKATGTAVELATRLNISRASVHRYLNDLRNLGAEICYCSVRKSYYYVEPFEFKL